MTEKRFTLDLEANVDLPILVDTKSGKWWFIRDTVGNCEILCNLLNEIVDENEQLRQEQQRLYNYFRDYLEDEMSAENFGEMWDTVKVDERW